MNRNNLFFGLFRRKHFGDDASLVTTLKHLAVLYKKLKEFDHAREIYEQLLQISIRSTGEQSDLTANAMVSWINAA